MAPRSFNVCTSEATVEDVYKRQDIDSHLLRHALLVGSEEIKLFLVDIIDALEALTDVYKRQGPHLRRV